MKTLAITLGAVVIAAGTSSALAVDVHTIFVVDESGSMGGEHAWLSQVVTDLDAGYAGAGITSNYALVGYGAASPAAKKISVGGGDFGTAAQFVTATSSLLTSGGFEDGWQAIDFALNNYSHPKPINMILVTDEDRDVTSGSSLTFSGLKTALIDAGALLNVVVDANLDPGDALGLSSDLTAYNADGSGGFTSTSAGVGSVASAAGTTETDYIDLAFATGGAAWDLNQLRVGGLTAESFSAAFVDIKVEEVQGQVVPTPSAALAGLALVATTMLRRRRAA